MLSIIHNGKVLDFCYKVSQKGLSYNFYVGDIFIGQIFKRSKHNWTGISFTDIKGSMGGFGSRYHASEYLLKLNKLGQGD